MSFTYAFIPHQLTKEIEIKSLDGSAGMEHDILVETSRSYFNQNSKAGSVDLSSLRESITQIHGAEASHSVSDEMLVKLASGMSNQCEIMALTVPTVKNKYHAVSLYAASDGKENGLPVNTRATALARAAGHSAADVRGDVFVGRCIDNESADVWHRIDFTLEDCSLDKVPDWCVIAQTDGGGGGIPGNNGTPSSLSGQMSALYHQQQQSQQKEREENNYTWSQTDEDVSITLVVPPGTKAKYIKVNFKSNALKVSVAGKTMINGKLGGIVTSDECTFTVEDSKQNGETCREMIIYLVKRKSGEAWSEALMHTLS